MPHWPGPLQGLTVITEDGVESPIQGTALNFQFLDGAGLADTRRILARSPLQHGATDRGYRLEPRRMVLQLYPRGEDITQTDKLRDRIAGIFAPTTMPLKLRATRDDQTARQIDCFVDGPIQFDQNEGDRLGQGQKVTIPLVAPDPTWYDPVQQVVSGALVNGDNIFNTSALGLTAEDWPIWDITGPLNTNFQIINMADNSQIAFSSAIPAGDTIRIDLRPGFKTVRRVSDFANRFNLINPTTIPAFATLRILPDKVIKAIATDPAVLSGPNNRWRLIAAGTTGASAYSLSWWKRWVSL